MNFQEPLSGLFERIARAIERLGPREPERPDFAASDAFVWQDETQSLLTVRTVNRVPLALLKGIDATRDTLLANTARFARGLPANNALLWGVRPLLRGARYLGQIAQSRARRRHRGKARQRVVLRDLEPQTPDAA